MAALLRLLAVGVLLFYIGTGIYLYNNVPYGAWKPAVVQLIPVALFQAMTLFALAVAVDMVENLSRRMQRLLDLAADGLRLRDGG